MYRNVFLDYGGSKYNEMFATELLTKNINFKTLCF